MKKIAVTIMILLAAAAKHTQAASLSFSPSQITDRTISTIDIILDPQGDSIVGTDLFIEFDPTGITIKDINNTGVFPNNPASITDTKLGLIKYSLTNDLNTYLSTRARIATITIEVLNDTPSTMSFDFPKDSTNRTTVVSASGDNVLTTTNSLSIAGKPRPVSTDTPAPSTTPQTTSNLSTPDAQPPLGLSARQSTLTTNQTPTPYPSPTPAPLVAGTSDTSFKSPLAGHNPPSSQPPTSTIDQLTTDSTTIPRQAAIITALICLVSAFILQLFQIGKYLNQHQLKLPRITITIR